MPCPADLTRYYLTQEAGQSIFGTEMGRPDSAGFVLRDQGCPGQPLPEAYLATGRQMLRPARDDGEIPLPAG
jgi:hypothetical protein